MFCVFDGHGGELAVSLAQQHLPSKITSSKEWESGETVQAIINAFQSVDTHILNEAGEAPESGAAATIAVIRSNILYVANVGDCAAFLCRQGVALEVTTLHRATNQKEQLRVQNCGGRIENDRLVHPVWNGKMVNLAVTRALGAAFFKLDKYHGTASGVSSEPDVFQVVLRSDDEFILIASDGFWDVVTPKSAITFVRNLISSQQKDCDFITKELVAMALAHGSNDNITVLFVSFHAEDLSPRGHVSALKKRRTDDTEAPFAMNQ